ncbi:MAG: biotin carboxylase [Alphaproteobacteria bacterium]|jgi:biotin carboxylase
MKEKFGRIMKETVLIIGVRRKCYQAAIKLGYDVLLWSDGELSDSRKKGLKGWLEVAYASCKEGLSADVQDFLVHQKISSIIANSEETVMLGARARRFLGLKELDFKITERFHNKLIMKNSARKAGIPVTDYELIDEKTTAQGLVENLGLPLVVKPVDESGAQDVKVARTTDDVHKIMQAGFLAEAFVEGTEVSVETFVQKGEAIFCNCTEYLHQWRKSAVPAQLDESLKKSILDLNERVIKHFKLDAGMTHAEFYLTKNGPVFGEIAVRPPGGYYMELIQRVYGFDAWEAYVQLSCGKEVKPLNGNPKGHAAVVMFHPGAGRVVAIEGEEKVKSRLSEIMEITIRSELGDVITEHTNTSNEVGHILFWEESRKDLLKALDYVEENLKFQLG